MSNCKGKSTFFEFLPCPDVCIQFGNRPTGRRFSFSTHKVANFRSSELDSRIKKRIRQVNHEINKHKRQACRERHSHNDSNIITEDANPGVCAQPPQEKMISISNAPFNINPT